MPLSNNQSIGNRHATELRFYGIGVSCFTYCIVFIFPDPKTGLPLYYEPYIPEFTQPPHMSDQEFAEMRKLHCHNLSLSLIFLLEIFISSSAHTIASKLNNFFGCMVVLIFI
jgi:hypothetical protein